MKATKTEYDFFFKKPTEVALKPLKIPGFKSKKTKSLKTPKKCPQIFINDVMEHYMKCEKVDEYFFINMLNKINSPATSDYKVKQIIEDFSTKELSELRRILEINPNNKNVLKYIDSIKKKISDEFTPFYNVGGKIHFSNPDYKFIEGEDHDVRKELIKLGHKVNKNYIPNLSLVNEMAKYLKISDKCFTALHLDRAGVCICPTISKWNPENKSKLIDEKVAYTNYLLDKENDWTLITIGTRPQKDMISTFKFLKENVKKVIAKLRKDRPGLEYFKVVESTKAGQPHVHLVVHARVSESERRSLKHYYSHKLGGGSYKNGIFFSEKYNLPRDGEEYSRKKAVKGLMNYVFKDSFHMLEREKWTLADWIFNAFIKLTKTQNKRYSNALSAKLTGRKSEQFKFLKDEIGMWRIYSTDMSIPVVVEIRYHKGEDDIEGKIIWTLHPNYNALARRIMEILK